MTTQKDRFDSVGIDYTVTWSFSGIYAETEVPSLSVGARARTSHEQKGNPTCTCESIIKLELSDSIFDDDSKSSLIIIKSKKGKVVCAVSFECLSFSE